LSYLLHPAALDDFGLVAAVDSYLKTFGKRHQLVAVLFHDHMDARLAPEIEAAAYRIIQEALTNVARHAYAKTCRVHLSVLDGRLRIRIEDDGRGFDSSRVSTPDRKGLGLIGIRERASYLKGSVNLESVPARGTCLVVEMPARTRLEPEALDVVAETVAANAHH
jgi:signal transduction histidine kinase